MLSLPVHIMTKIQELENVTPDQFLQSRLKEYWNNLKISDAVLEDFIDGGMPQTGNIVLSGILYTLNNEIDNSCTKVLKSLEMPDSVLSEEKMKKLRPLVTQQPGHVEIDGIISQISPFAGLDPLWAELFISYLYYQVFPDKVAAFHHNPAIIKIDENKPLTIAIMGDWGSGNYDDFGFSSPSSLVGKGIASITPEITIHLGDVYYAGTSEQMIEHLLPDFPKGSMASFALNGNHEMFDGANGYFNTALSHPLFRAQQQTSYFAILYGHCVIIGLDTAYYDTSLYHLNGTLEDKGQLDFLNSLNITDDNFVVLLTHHAAIEYDGSAPRQPLFDQVYKALGNRFPDYWYYGHIHNGIVYNEESCLGRFVDHAGKYPALRCLGHGSIPIGSAKGLHDTVGNPIKGVDYFAHTPMPNPQNKPGLEKRVLNGFGAIFFDNKKFSERIYESSFDNNCKVVWQNDTYTTN